MRISYHSWKAFKECPRKFHKQYILKEPPTVPINEYFTLYGKLTEKFFELYCNIWSKNNSILFPKSIGEKLKIIYEDVLRSTIVDWTPFYCKFSKEEIFKQSYDDIINILKSENQNFFLNTKSEIKIELSLKNSHVISGRLDFIHSDRVLFDGKGTNKIGKNIDKNQLLFYALLYFFQFKKLPDKLGFFYYRFNTFIPVPIDQTIINEFRSQLSLDIKEITKIEDFIATPSPKSCKYCKYFNGCLDHLKDKASRAKSSKIKNLNGEGIIEFSF